jgi:hypothetical protein
MGMHDEKTTAEIKNPTNMRSMSGIDFFMSVLM